MFRNIAASAQVRQKCSQNCCQRGSAAEMRSELLPARSAAEMQSDCCQIMTSGQYEGIITQFEGTGMKSGRFEGNAPPN